MGIGWGLLFVVTSPYWIPLLMVAAGLMLAGIAVAAERFSS